MTVDTAEYCREIEAYLCRKNDGHLVRIVGPSFDLVSGWAEQGVPIKVACQGIDRYFERYYAKGPRRRPVRIDFCDADVLDAFDAWRRATGVATTVASGQTAEVETASRRGPSLPAHLERVLRRLTTARVNGTLDQASDGLLDRVSRELETAKAGAKTLRGEARQALVDRLSVLDRELVETALARLDGAARQALVIEADEELASYRAAMPADAFERARATVIERLVRDRANLPTIAFT